MLNANWSSWTSTERPSFKAKSMSWPPHTGPTEAASFLMESIEILRIDSLTRPVARKESAATASHEDAGRQKPGRRAESLDSSKTAFPSRHTIGVYDSPTTRVRSPESSRIGSATAKKAEIHQSRFRGVQWLRDTAMRALITFIPES